MISASDITVRIGDKTLVQKVSMNLEPGKLSVILGKNGAGKSTFLKVLSGDIKEYSGKVTVEGIALDNISPLHLARKRAVMMQNLHLSFSFSALDVVLMGRSPHTKGFESNHDREIAVECMRQAQVDHLMERQFPTLSGGEKQRVQFARMLAQLWNRIENRQNSCLMLDEPLSSLDLAQQHSIMHLLKKLTRKRVAVMVILHDLNLAAQYADMINVMKDGKSYILGTPDEVFHPDIIEMAFDCPVHIMRHPHQHCPLVVASNGNVQAVKGA